MNFTNRDSNTQQSQPGRSQGNANVSVAGPLNNTLRHARKNGNALLKGTWGIMLVSLLVIVIGILYLLHVANPNEGKYVQGSNLQAVFLNNGQVYFGHIKTVSQRYIDLQDIFYLNNSSSTSGSGSSGSSNNLSLVKLGCELHGPFDEMVINQEQVTFWENLRPTGQVAKAVAQYQQQNPHGQTCSSGSSSSTNQSSSSSSATNPQSSGSSSNAKQ